MTSQHEEYSNLLQYLETQNKVNESLTSEKVIFDNSQIYSDVVPKLQSTAGFDVKKFEGLLRNKLQENFQKSQSYERPYISVSELLGCLRQNYYYRLKYPVDLKKQFNFPYVYLIQEVGNTVHEIIQKLYNFSEVEKTIVYEDYHVKGRVDAIKDNFLYEIKTIDEEKFKGEILTDHYNQGCIYSVILNEKYQYTIDTLTVIYVLRTLKKIVPFDTKIDYNKGKSFLEKGKILKKNLNQKTIPDKIGATKEICQWCLFEDFCKKDDEKQVPIVKEKTKHIVLL